MPYMQLQLAVDRFLSMFREGLDGQMVSAIDEERIENVGTLLIERVEALPTTTIDDSDAHEVDILWGDYKEDPQQTSVFARRYFIVQPLTIYSTLLVGDGTANPTLQPVPPVPATLRINIDAWIAADTTVPVPNPLPEGWAFPDWIPHMFLQGASLEIGAMPTIPGVPPDVVNNVVNRVKGRLQGRLGPSSKKLLTTTPIGKVDFVNAGLAFDLQKSRMSILMQSPPSIEARVWVWQKFHSRELDDLLQSGAVRHEWAQAADSVFMELSTAFEIEKGLKEKAGDVKLKQFPHVAWSTPNDVPTLSVYVPVKQNAPDPLGGTIDVDLNAEVTYTVDPPGTLKMDADLKAVVTGASFSLVLLATVGAVVGIAILSGVSFLLLGPLAGLAVAGVVSVLLGLLNTIKGPSLAPHEMGDFHCNEGPVFTGDYGTKFTQHVTCTRTDDLKFSLEAGREARLLLREARGLPSSFATHNSALVTAGTIKMPPPQAWGMTVETTEPRWEDPQIPCGASFAAVLALYHAGQIMVRARGEVFVTPLNVDSPVIVEAATLRSPDPLHVVHEIAIESWGYVTSVNVFVRWDEQYQDERYPFWILLRTSKGFRLVKVEPPPALTKAEMEHIALGGILAGMSDCYTRSAPFFAHYRGIDVKWIPDPAPHFRDIEHLWQIKVRGLQPGEGVHVTGGDQVVLGEFRSTARGEAVFSTALSPAQGARLSLQRLRAGPRTVAESGPPAGGRCEEQIDVEQTVILKRAHLDLNGRVEQVSIDVIEGVPSLVAAGVDTLTVLDVTTPDNPSIRATVLIDGIRGALPLGDSLLVYGAFGAVKTRWREAGTATPRRGRGRCRPADGSARWWTDAATRKVRWDGSRFYVLTDEGVMVYAGNGRRVGNATELLRVDDLEIVGRHLFALSSGFITTYALEDALPLRRISELPAADAVALSVPGVGLSGYLYARNRHGGRLIDVARPDRPEIASAHDADPFWARAIQRLRTIVAVDAAGGIDIYSTEASARR